MTVQEAIAGREAVLRARKRRREQIHPPVAAPSSPSVTASRRQRRMTTCYDPAPIGRSAPITGGRTDGREQWKNGED